MALAISGVSIGAALAGGAAAAVGSYAVGQILGSGGSSGSTGGYASPTSTGSVASAADPFASQRAQYAAPLQQLISTPVTNTNAGDYAVANAPTSTQGLQLMQQMLTPGYQFNSTDPSYAWRLSQGIGAVSASKAASGLLNSGNAATALMDYGQNAASQEFAAQFARAGTENTAESAANQFANLQRQQTFSNVQAMNQFNQDAYQQSYNRLATLSGATVGSPAAAGQLMQQQQAAGSAGAQQIIDPITGAIKNIATNAFGSGGSSTPTDYSGYALSNFSDTGAAAGVTPYL